LGWLLAGSHTLAIAGHWSRPPGYRWSHNTRSLVIGWPGWVIGWFVRPSIARWHGCCQYNVIGKVIGKVNNNGHTHLIGLIIMLHIQYVNKVNTQGHTMANNTGQYNINKVLVTLVIQLSHWSLHHHHYTIQWSVIGQWSSIRLAGSRHWPSSLVRPLPGWSLATLAGIGLLRPYRYGWLVSHNKWPVINNTGQYVTVIGWVIAIGHTATSLVGHWSLAGIGGWSLVIGSYATSLGHI